jgi:hypothetical protein
LASNDSDIPKSIMDWKKSYISRWGATIHSCYDDVYVYEIEESSNNYYLSTYRLDGDELLQKNGDTVRNVQFDSLDSAKNFVKRLTNINIIEDGNSR